MTSSLKLFLNSLLYETNRFQVAMHLFSNRSQRTSKCSKNISDTLSCALCATFLFLPHFDVMCDLLLNRRTATWNLFVKWKSFSCALMLLNPVTPRMGLSILPSSFNTFFCKLVMRIWGQIKTTTSN